MHINLVIFTAIYLSHLIHLAIKLTICTSPALIKFTQHTAYKTY